jgi:hypothetical protein
MEVGFVLAGKGKRKNARNAEPLTRNATPKTVAKTFFSLTALRSIRMADRLEPAFSIPKGFKIHQVRARTPEVLQGITALAAPTPPPTLGPLVAFEGTWSGIGFNTIFRPQKRTFPVPHPAPSDNLLELNLTSETLSFSPSLGSIPNRGMLQERRLPPASPMYSRSMT